MSPYFFRIFNCPVSTKMFWFGLWYKLKHAALTTNAQLRTVMSHLCGMKIITKQRAGEGGVWCSEVCVTCSFCVSVHIWAADRVNVQVWMFVFDSSHIDRHTHTHTYSPVPLTPPPLPLLSEVHRKECETISDVSEGFSLSGPDTPCKYSRQVGGFIAPE